jgi:hypothetical protein
MTSITLPDCSASDLAEITGITTQRIHQLVQQGVIHKTERGVFNLPESVNSYCEYIRGVSRGSDTKKEENTHRNKLLEAKADIAQMEARIMKGDLLNADQVYRDNFTMGTMLKNNLLSIPDRIGQIVAAETDPFKVYEIIETEVNNSLNSIVKMIEECNFDSEAVDITRSESIKHLNKGNENAK